MSSRSQLYPYGRQLFATGALDWATANIKIALLAAAFVPDFTQQFLSGINSGYILGTTANLTGTTGDNGLLDGNTASFGVIASTAPAGYVVFYHDTGNPATSPLILFIDSPDLQGMPQVLDGLQYFLYENLTYGGWARL